MDMLVKDKIIPRVTLKDFEKRCLELDLEMLVPQIFDGRALVGCEYHGGAWCVSFQELSDENTAHNCPECYKISKRLNA